MTAASARTTTQMNNDGDGRVSPLVWSYEAFVLSGFLSCRALEVFGILENFYINGKWHAS
jgi:hypothetical protein